MTKRTVILSPLPYAANFRMAIPRRERLFARKAPLVSSILFALISKDHFANKNDVKEKGMKSGIEAMCQKQAGIQSRTNERADTARTGG